jgi:hypothetical protein
MPVLRSKTSRTIGGTVYVESHGFAPGLLPTELDVIEVCFR